MEEPVSHGPGTAVPERRHLRGHPADAALSARFLVQVSAGIHGVSVRDTHIERVRLEAVPERRHVLAARHQGAPVQLRARIYRYENQPRVGDLAYARAPRLLTFVLLTKRFRREFSRAYTYIYIYDCRGSDGCQLVEKKNR